MLAGGKWKNSINMSFNLLELFIRTPLFSIHNFKIQPWIILFIDREIMSSLSWVLVQTKNYLTLITILHGHN